MPATDAWPVVVPQTNDTWIPWFTAALARTSDPLIHHMEIEYQGFKAYVSPRHADWGGSYDQTDTSRFVSLMEGKLSLELIWYFDRKGIVAEGGWAPNPPCIAVTNHKGQKLPYVCAPAFTAAGDRSVLYFNAERAKCTFDPGQPQPVGTEGPCVISAAWRTPALPRLNPNAASRDDTAQFLDEAGLLQVGLQDEDAAVPVRVGDAYSSINPNSVHARFHAVLASNASAPVYDCCYQLPVATTNPAVHYATYDPYTNSERNDELLERLAWTTVSSCTAQEAFVDGMPCVEKQLPAGLDLLRPSQPWPPPPPNAPAGAPRPPDSHIALPRRGLKTYVTRFDAQKSEPVLIAAGMYYFLMVIMVVLAILTRARLAAR